MQIEAGWIDRPETQVVMRMLAEAGNQALFVGGCVRNALLGAPVADIDVATDALPETVVALAEAADLKVVPTGIEHGTVTVISSGLPHEITTFRRDLETDGRRAMVAFSGDIAEDAARRDFTMNALYAQADGTVIDPLGGLPDLLARRVIFVGDATARIREDYLRILRFFRFHAWYGGPDGGLDPEGLAACAAHSGGIDTLSRERIGAEMRKLLAATDPSPSIAAMQVAGILRHVAAGMDTATLPVLVHLEGNEQPVWVRRLAALGGDDITEALRLSRDETRRLADIRAAMADPEPPATLAYRFGSDTARDAILVRAALLGAPLPDGWRASVSAGAQAVFPVIAADLQPALQGRDLGRALRQIEERWIASGFRLSREELLG